MQRALVFVLLLLAASASDDASRRAFAPAEKFATRRVVAVTRSGPVAGTADALAVRWRGVPYARPPVGELRFRPPLLPEPWNETLDCTHQARRICPQLASLFGVLVVGEEDCLYVDVFAPSAPSPDLLPVVVFVHGGAYVLGDDSELGLYDGSRLASNASVVVVTLDYRLGVLGFLAHPALRAAGHTSNLGLLDQRAALRWVGDNIAAFGGDPRRILLVGQSAGAMSVCSHVASPASEGLFRAAIMESGNCDSPLLWAPLDAALQQGHAFAAAHGCQGDNDDAVACLQSLPLAVLMAHDLAPSGAPLAPLVAWVPTVDRRFDGVPEMPLSALRRSRRVPCIVGTVRDEGTMFAAVASSMFGKAPTPITEVELAELLGRVYNTSTVDAVLLYYSTGSPTERLALILRDALFACPARRTAAALATTGRAWQYIFDHELHWGVSRLGLGTYHASELPFVFRNHGKHAFSDSDEMVEALFSQLWGAFAREADMKATAPPEWPAYNAKDEPVLRLNEAPSVAKHLLSNCSFWDAVEPQVHMHGALAVS